MKKIIIPALFCLIVQFGFSQKATDTSTLKVSPNGTINFAVMDNAPQFSGCENTGTIKQQNKCTSEKIEAFIQQAFNKDVARSISNNSANNSVYIRFIVNTQGAIENVGVRTNNTAMKKEVERIVKTLPSFSRGTYQGTPVNVSYAVMLQADRLLRNAVKN
ncbi:energy transducer TonB [Kordia sp.]|uniref:energy transducer TonB n=1 Tax=Kordia sp. TaxID=1965332 RepID=UPI003D6B13CC